jgi:hypothetical protein
MSINSECLTRSLLIEQISESADTYARTTLRMLEISDVRSDEYAEAAKLARSAQAELKYLNAELNAHCGEHGCTGVAGNKKGFRQNPFSVQRSYGTKASIVQNGPPTLARRVFW